MNFVEVNTPDMNTPMQPHMITPQDKVFPRSQQLTQHLVNRILYTLVGTNIYILTWFIIPMYILPVSSFNCMGG